MAVSPRYLVFVYAVLPVSLLLIVVDLCLLGGSLRSALPASPHQLALFSLFFVLPHILASSLAFLDHSYLSHYRGLLTKGVIGVGLLAFFLPRVAPVFVVLLINGVLTIYHVLAQQFGLAFALSRKRSRLWKATGLLAGAGAYYLFYFQGSIPESQKVVLRILLGVALIVFLGATVVFARRSEQRIGKVYIWSNFALVLGAYTCIEAGYSFFAVLIPRVVHDLTAFGFYIVHDFNRNRSQSPNWAIRAIRGLPGARWVPVVAIIPLTAVALGYALGQSEALMLINFVTLLHYWTEANVWKFGTPHRSHVPLAA